MFCKLIRTELCIPPRGGVKPDMIAVNTSAGVLVLSEVWLDGAGVETRIVIRRDSLREANK